jgi:hypothetical protein
MLGRNPLYVAQQHGHRILTMLTTYAAWTEGSLEADISAIRRAMNMSAYATRNAPVRHSEFGKGIGHSRRHSRQRKTGKKLQQAAIETAPPSPDLILLPAS